MKKLCALVLLGGFVLQSASGAVDLKQSKITQVVKSVDIISSNTHHAAEVNDIFKIPDVMRTGPASRAEMIANDGTITRVGANTIFSFDPADRTIDLRQGSLLFHAPHGKGGGTIRTGSATASVLGTTIIVTTTPNGGFKVLCLEGEAEIRFLNGLHETLQPGQMTFILPGGGASPIIVFRLDVETQGSLLLNGFNDQLPSWPAILNQITQQLTQLLNGRVVDTDLSVGDNATPQTVQVVFNLRNNGNLSSSSIIGSDHTANQSLPVNYSPLNPKYTRNSSFRPPGNFSEGLAFLGLTTPSSGFVGQNIDIDTASIDLSSFTGKPDFDIMAGSNMRIWQSLTFCGDDSDLPGTVGLFAAGTMAIAQDTTLKANTGTFGLVAGDFATLDTSDGSVDIDNTLKGVSVINGCGNVDVLSQLDLTWENDCDIASCVHAGGDVNIQSDGALTLGSEDCDGYAFEAKAGGSVNLSAVDDLSMDDVEVDANQDVNLVAGGTLDSFLYGGDIYICDSDIEAGECGSFGGDVNITAYDGNVCLDDDSISASSGSSYDGVINVNAEGNINVLSSCLMADGGVNLTADNGYVNVYNSGDSDLRISDWYVSAGTYVSLGADDCVKIDDSVIQANDGDITVTANDGKATICDTSLDAFEGNICATADSGCLKVSDSDLVANGSVHLNADDDINICDTYISASEGNFIAPADSSESASYDSVCISSGGELTIDGTDGSVSDSGYDIGADHKISLYGEDGVTIDDAVIETLNSCDPCEEISVTSDGNICIDDSTLSGDGSIKVVSDDGDIHISDSTLQAYDGSVTIGSACETDGVKLSCDSICADGCVSVEAACDVNISDSTIKSSDGNIKVLSDGDDIHIDDSTLNAYDGSVTIGSACETDGVKLSCDSICADDCVSVEAACNVNICDTSITSTDGSIKAKSGDGMLYVDADNGFDAPAVCYDLNASDSVYLDGECVSIKDTAIEGGDMVCITGTDGNVELKDVNISTTDGDVDVTADSGTLDLGFGCADYGVNIYAGGSVNLSGDDGVNITGDGSCNPITITAEDGDVDISSLDSSVDIENGVTINGSGDVYITAGESSDYCFSGDENVSISDASVTAGCSIYAMANNGDVCIDNAELQAGGDVNICAADGGIYVKDGSEILANGSVSLNADNDITICDSYVVGSEYSFTSDDSCLPTDSSSSVCISSGGELSIEGDGSSSFSVIAADHKISLYGEDGVSIDHALIGTLNQDDPCEEVDVTSDGNICVDESLLGGFGDINVVSDNDDINISDSFVIAGGNVAIGSACETDGVNLCEDLVYAEGCISVKSVGDVNIADSAILSDDGRVDIAAGRNVSVHGEECGYNSIQGNSVKLTAYNSVSICDEDIMAEDGDVIITSGDSRNEPGVYADYSEGQPIDIGFTAQSITTDNTLSSGNYGFLPGTVDWSDFSYAFDGSVSVEAGSTLTVSDATVVAEGGSVTLISDTSDVDIEDGSTIQAQAGDMDITSTTGGVNISGDDSVKTYLEADCGSVNINASGDVNIGDSTINASRDVSISSGGMLDINSDGSSYDDYYIYAGGAISLSGECVSDQDTALYAHCGDVDINATDGGVSLGDTEVVAYNGGISVGGDSVGINDSYIEAEGNVCISAAGDICIAGDCDYSDDIYSDGGNIGIVSYCGNIDIKDSDIEANGDVNIGEDGALDATSDDSAGNIRIKNSEIEADYGSVTIGALGCLDIRNSEISGYDVTVEGAGGLTLSDCTSISAEDGVSLTSYCGDVGIYCSTINAGVGSCGDSVTIGAEDGDVNMMDDTINTGYSDICISDDSSICANGNVCITGNGGTVDIYGDNVSICDTDFNFGGNISISDSSITADDGDVDITANGALLICADGDVSLSDDEVGCDITICDSDITANCGNVNITDDFSGLGACGLSGADIDINDSTITATGLAESDGNVSISTPGSISIDDSGIYASQNVIIGTLGTFDLDTLSAVPTDEETTGNIDISCSEIEAGYEDSCVGGNVAIVSYGGDIDLADDEISATAGGTENISGNILIGAIDGDLCITRSCLTADDYVIVGAVDGDVNVDRSTLCAGDDLVVAAIDGNISINHSDLDAGDAVALFATGSVNVYDSYESRDLCIDGWAILAGDCINLSADNNLDISDSVISSCDGIVDIAAGKNLSICTEEDGCGFIQGDSVKLSAYHNVSISGEDIMAEDGDVIITSGDCQDNPCEYVPFGERGCHPEDICFTSVDITPDSTVDGDFAPTDSGLVDLAADGSSTEYTGDITIEGSTGVEINDDTLIAEQGDADITADTGDVSIADGVTIQALDGDVDITSTTGNVDISGGDSDSVNTYLEADCGSVDITADGSVNISDSIINASQDVSISSGGMLTIDADDTSDTGYDIYAGGAISLSGECVSIENTALYAHCGDLDVEATDGDLDLNNVGMTAYDGGIALCSEGTIGISDSSLEAYCDVSINAGEDIAICGDDSTASGIYSDNGSISITSGGDVAISDTDLEANDNVCISALGDVCISSDDSEDVISGICAANGNVDITSCLGDISIEDVDIYAKGDVNIGEDETLDTLAAGTEEGGSVGIMDSEIAAGYGSVNIGAYGCLNVCDSDICGYNVTMESGGPLTLSGCSSVTASDTVSLISYCDDVDIYCSTITAGGDNVTIGAEDGMVDMMGDVITVGSSPECSDSDIYISDDTSICANGNVCITANGGTVDIYGECVSICDTGFNFGGNLSISDSSITANDGDVDITSTGGLLVCAEGDVNLNDDYATAGDITICDSDITATSGDVNISDGLFGVEDLSVCGGDIDISGSTITASQDVNICAIGDVNIGYCSTIAAGGGEGVCISDDTSTYTSPEGICITSTGGTIDINGENVSICNSQFDLGGNISISGSIIAAGAGDVNITADGTLDVSAADSLTLTDDGVSGGNITICDSDITATSGNVNINNDLTGIDIDGLSVCSADIDISDSTITAPFDSTEDVGNICVNALGSVNILDSTMTAEGNINITAGDTVDITSDGTVACNIASEGTSDGDDVTVTAANGITVSDASISADPTAGTVTLTSTSTSGTVTVNEGASIQTAYLNINSGGGILIDGTGTLSGNTMTATAGVGNTDGATATVKDADLSGFATVNVSAHTVDLCNVNFSSTSTYNFNSFNGDYYINNGNVAGAVNFNNDTLDKTTDIVTTDGDTASTENPHNNANITVGTSAGSPGIYIGKNSN